MLVCHCGRWMHAEGVEERVDEQGQDRWLVRSECLECGVKVGLEGLPAQAVQGVDRLLWSDDARHVLDRMPPYLSSVYKSEIDGYAESINAKVVTWALLAEARQGGSIPWDAEAERRLNNIPAPVRAMAKIELERTAAEKGMPRVTVGLMEEVKMRYFGFAEKT